MANSLNITIENVANSYEGKISTEDVAWAETKIDEAVRELLSIIPSIPRRIANGTLDAELVMDKVVGAVLRVVRNPKGIESEGEGDYNIRLRNSVASGDIWYQEKDLIQLGKVIESKNKPRTVHSKATAVWGFPG